MQRHAEIIVISFERGERSCLVFNSLLVGALGNSEIMAKMPLPGFLFLTGFCEPLGTVLPQRFEQPIPRPAGRHFVGHDERAIHEATDQVRDVGVALRSVELADAFGGFERPPSREDRQPIKEASFRLAQQLVAPVHRRP